MSASKQKNLTKIFSQAIIAQSKEEDDWVLLSAIGGYIHKHSPSFDSRNYGYSKMEALVKTLYGIEARKNEETGRISIRLKKPAPRAR